MSRNVHVTIAVVLIILFSAAVAASEPLKWSAPMNQYPSQWYPSAPPPQNYNNPYGYQYPYSGYGYGNWGNYQGAYGGFSGNPYYNYYGQ